MFFLDIELPDGTAFNLLKIAIEKAQEEVEKKNIEIKIKTLLKNIQDGENHHSRRIILKDKYGIQIVNIQDIIHVEAMGNYTKFFVKNCDQPII